MASEGRDPADRNVPNAPRTAVQMRLARLALGWERLWPALWPAVAVAGLFLVFGLLDVLPALPAFLHTLILAAFVAGFAVLLWRGVRGFLPPGLGAARRRLEQASGLEHRPLAAVEDAQATGRDDPASAALWQLHQKRMADAARSIRVGVPSPGMARRDPMSLRGALILALVIAAAAAWPDPSGRLGRALKPDFSAMGGGVAALEMWITPPAYTGIAPLFPLRTAKNPGPDGSAGEKTQAAGPARLMVPAGSELTAQVRGGSSLPRLIRGKTIENFTRVDPRHSRIKTVLEAGGGVEIRSGGTILGAWDIDLVPDREPDIKFSERPAGTAHYTMRLVFEAADDYGLASAKAEIRRTYEDGKVIGKEVEEIELPLPAQGAKHAQETGYHDLTPHKWAGLAVTIELAAKDMPGQVGRSRPQYVTLPERVFVNPVARAIVEQRKRLTTEPENLGSIARELEQIAARPTIFQHDSIVFLSLVTARSRLKYQSGKEAIEPVRDLLWDTALRIEDGVVSIAERQLRAAQQALRKALAENASDAELERLMRQLRAALNRYLAALAEQMRRNPQAMNPQEITPDMQLMQGADFQRMLDQIRDMMRSGARQAAREMLARLQSMIENMRAMQMFRMQRGGGKVGAAMRRLQDMMRRQQQLMNRSYRRSQNLGPLQGGTGAGRQRALQRMLREFRMRMQGRGAGGQALRFLDRAGDAMGRAADELQRGQPGNAVGLQGEALDQLQRAGRGMMREFMDRFARQSGMGNRKGRRPPRMDPLGREVVGGDVDTGDVEIPDEADVQRARKILDELRRRSGQGHRPRLELEYIERLLERF